MATTLNELEKTTDVSDEMLPGYEILSVVGAGGFGTVFRARQLKLDRIVAVKVIHVDRLVNADVGARVQTEALALARFHHPNIVQVFDYGRDQRRIFIAMELLEGEDLAQRIRRVGKIDERMAWAIARQTAASLGHAFSCGVIHRDIKPANLYLVPPPTGLGLPGDLPMVKVTDFGLALTRWTASQVDAHKTAPGALLGTPTYMAPEQYRRTSPIDHRADIYALGATLYHALAGRAPFVGDTVWDVMAAKMEGLPKTWPEVSSGTVALLQSMMATEPNDRPRTYEELIERIDGLSLTNHSPAGSTKRSNRSLWRTWPSWMVAAMVVTGTAAALAYYPRASAAHSYSPTGDVIHLFDSEQRGEDWRVVAELGGSRHVEPNESDEKTLAFEGFVSRQFPTADNFKIEILVDLHEAAKVELQFAFSDSSPIRAERLVVQINREQGAQLGSRVGETGPFVPASSAVSMDAARPRRNNRPERQVTMSRQGKDWVVYFGTCRVGAVHDSRGSIVPLLFLFADGGGEGKCARISDVTFQRLDEIK